MVRTTIACSWCRRSKIKCMHHGSAPCRNCLRAGRTGPGECILAGPSGSTPQRSRARQKDGDSEPPGQLIDEPPALQPALRSPVYDRPPQDIVARTSHAIIVKAAGLFRRKFPELAFLHLPTFNPADQQHGVQIAAMLAICQRFMLQSRDLFTAEEYASHARKKLSGVPLESPNRTTVQALLVMSMYEWGGGNGYEAWMYSGMATRMMQCLNIWKPQRNPTEIELQIQNRTYWGCFIMDRLVSCGRSQPTGLPIDKMPISLPSGEQDFAFGCSPTVAYTVKSLRDSMVVSRVLGTVDNYYNVLVRGFDIWAQTLEFVIDGGRRQPGMADPENCPWVQGSRWRDIYDSLSDWRSSQGDRLTYPSSPVSVHVSLGNGEAFAYVNLLYYLSILFLNREYIPFLPTLDAEPQGPIDPPILQAVAPPDWWIDRSGELFYAAGAITEILQALADLDSPLSTPFSGFCAFSAANMNLYDAAFPRMNLGRSPNASAMAQANIEYLDEFRNLWKRGNGWWKTIKRTRRLYQAATADRTKFHGKTRADFLALEASIHDYSGTSPTQDDNLAQETSRSVQVREPQQLALDHAAALSLQEISIVGTTRAIQPQEHFDDNSFQAGNTAGYEPWNELWPMWGEFEMDPM